MSYLIFFREGQFGTESKSPIANGKLVDGKIPFHKIEMDHYNTWIDNFEAFNALREILEYEIESATTQASKEDAMARYRKHIQTYKKAPEITKLTDIRMRVINRRGGQVTLEPAFKKDAKKLTKLGYLPINNNA